MKATRRFLAGISALTLAAALSPMAAFAEDAETKTLDKDKTSDTMIATYTVNPTYTVTIPAAADIADTEAAAIAQEIKAENVVLEEGQKVTVTLSGASNTTAGSVFNAMTGKSGDANRSTVKYKIKKTDDAEGTDIALNGKVAEFTGNQSVELKFIKDNSEDNKPTAAGAHTEQLTFSIAVEGAESPYKYLSGQSVLLRQIAVGDTFQAGVKISQNSGQLWWFNVYVDGVNVGEYMDDASANDGLPAYTTTGSFKVTKKENPDLYFESYTPAT